MPQVRIVPVIGLNMGEDKLLTKLQDLASIYILCYIMLIVSHILKVMVPNSFSVVVEGWLCKPVQPGLIPLPNCESNLAVSKSFVETYSQNEFQVRDQCGNKIK